MKISDKRASALYEAIREPVMTMRLSYTKARPISADELDARLFKLEQEIWREVRKALNLSRD